MIGLIIFITGIIFDKNIIKISGLLLFLSPLIIIIFSILLINKKKKEIIVKLPFRIKGK